MNGCQKSKGQKGSALVVIALIILLSSVLGLALLSNTLTSHQSVLANENETRAKYLAEYAATLGLDELQKELEELSQQSGQQVRQCGEIDTIVRDLIDDFATKSGVPVEGLKGEEFVYRLEFDESSLKEAKTICEQNSAIGLQYAVKGYLVASGIADKEGKNAKRVTFKVPIQITNIADVFNFALSAQNNIWLNGGVEIHGSLYAGNALALHKIAHFQYGSQYNFTTVYPEINGKISAGPLDKPTHYIYHINTHNNDGDHVGKHSLSKLNPVPVEDLSKFGYINGNYRVAKVPSITFPELNMEQIKKDIQNVAGYSESELRKKGKTYFENKKNGINYYYITGAEEIEDCLIWPICWGTGEWKESKTTYFIGKNNGKKGPFKGVYYINGKLEIDGDVDLQGTFYVDGNVTIKEVNRTSNPIAAAIISSGKIEIYNNHECQNTPAILNAFFWSLNEDFIIYGVGSNVQINGGVIAKNLVLNAVRGNTSGCNGNNKLKFDDQTYSKYPRLTVNYDEQFITHPPAGVPTNEGFKLSQIGQWEYVEE